MATAVLFVVLESLAFAIVPVKLTVEPEAAGCGVTGILNVSVARDAILVVLVHVTVEPTCAPQDHQLSIKALAGPVILAGKVKVLVCTPVEARFQALVTVIGTWDKYVVVSGPSGCPIPGIRSGTFAATYGKSLHSTAPEYVPGVVPRSQFTPNPRSQPVARIVFVKLAPLTICVRTEFHQLA
jgi:hypothetical protein